MLAPLAVSRCCDVHLRDRRSSRARRAIQRCSDGAYYVSSECGVVVERVEDVRSEPDVVVDPVVRHCVLRREPYNLRQRSADAQTADIRLIIVPSPTRMGLHNFPSWSYRSRFRKPVRNLRRGTSRSAKAQPYGGFNASVVTGGADGRSRVAFSGEIRPLLNTRRSRREPLSESWRKARTGSTSRRNQTFVSPDRSFKSRR